MKTLRVGVVGVGHIGSNHARLYAELDAAAFAAAYDVDLARGRHIAGKYGAFAATSLKEFAEKVDAASIATPTNTHYEIAKELLAAGKHLLVEKPIAENAPHASELAKIAAQKGLILQVGHVERFNPVLAILHLVRSPIQNIDAVGVPVLSRSEDIANARLRFEDGCVANITSSRISPERMRKIRVFQEDAYLSLDYQNQSGEIYRRVDGKIARSEVEIEHGEPLKRQLAAFIECAKTGRQPKVSGFQAAAALELAVEITKRIASSG